MANRSLGIGDGLFSPLDPPAQVQEDHDADYCLRQAKISLDRLGQDAETFKRWIVAARLKTPEGEWSKRLRSAGIARSTAYHILKKIADDMPDDQEVVQIGPYTDSSNKDLRQPGQKPKREKEDPLDRAKRVIHERVDEAETFHQISEHEARATRNQVDAAIAAVWQLFQTEKRQAMKPLHKTCRRCGKGIVIAQSAKSGKSVAYEQGHGRFLFDKEGRMEYSKTGGDYFPHRVRCSGISK